MAAPRSPAAETIEQLVWGRLSSFWSRDYSPDDRERMNAVYEGCMEALDAEFTRLFEVNMSKSVDSAQPFTQRRWLRLDLNRHAELAAFLKFLSTSSAGSAASNDASNVLSCDTNERNHAQHWHITFPFTVPAGDPISRSTIELYYQIDVRLVEVYFMKRDPRTGIVRGVRQRPGVDYVVTPSGTGIRIIAAAPAEQYEVNVGFDLNSSLYDGLNPIVAYAPGYDTTGPNAVRVNPELSIANLPIHAMVVKNVRDAGSGGLTETNTSTFTTTYQFLPWTGNGSGPQHGAEPGVVVLPNTVVIEATDAVFVFGLVRGNFVENHKHTLATTILNPGAAPRGTTTMFRAAGSTSVVEFDTLIKPGVYESIGYLGQPFEVLVDGELLPRGDYRYGEDGKLYLKNPIVWGVNEYRSVVIRSTDEYDTLHGGAADQHIHIECLLQSARPPEFAETFDDGGDFDDEQGGTFDDTRTLNVVYLDDVVADLATLEVWVDGVRRMSDIDYVASFDADTKRVRLSFSFNIKGRSIYVSYRRESRTFVYGRFAKGFFGETLSGLLTDIKSLQDAFAGSTGLQIKNINRLVEAAQVAAAGGNPLLTLFYDERPEYSDLPVDSDNVAMSLDDMRLVESQGTKLVAIPFLCDRVLRPAIRLEAGIDYDIVNGEIRSSFDLTAQRYASDATPGVWWCPIVILDEQMLRKNFGSLLGDERADSSSEYKTALQANLSLRFKGPVIQDIERCAAVLYGSPIYTQDGRVTSVETRTIGYDVTLSSGSKTQTVRVPSNFERPIVGEPVLRSQSLARPALFNGPLTGLIMNKKSTIIAELPAIGAQAGDIVYLTTFDPADPLHTAIPFISKILTVKYDSDFVPARTTIALEDTPRFEVTTESTMRVLRDAGPPYAALDGIIAAVDNIQETVISASNIDYVLPPGRLPEQRVGEYVVRGQPLYQSYAKLYDDARRPNWHWQLPSDYEQDWSFITSGRGVPVSSLDIADRRYATVYPPAEAGDYSTIVLDPISPIVKRGMRIAVVDDRTLATFDFTVVGLDEASVFVSPMVSETINGTATVQSTSSSSKKEFFGMATPPGSAPIQSQLAFAQPIRSRVIQVQNTSRFPSAGDCVIRLPNGGSIEIAYNRIARGFLLDVEWPADFPALTGPRPSPGVEGPLTTLIPETAVVRLVSEHRARRLNPAFVSLVNLRVVRDLSTSDPRVIVTEENADSLYGFFKNTSAVLESGAVTRPQVLRDLMDDVVPPGSTLVTMSRHRIVDVYSGGIGEK